MNSKISTAKNLFGAKPWRSCLRLLIALAILCGGSMARAIQSDTWVGGGADNNWTTTNNWDVGGSLAVGMTTNGDALIFGFTATGPLNPNNNFQSIGITNIGIDSITLNTNGYAVGGNAIQITNGITDNNGANTISLPLRLGASQTFANYSASGYTNTESGTIGLFTNTLMIDGGAPVFLTGVISSTNGGQLILKNTFSSTARLGAANGFGTNMMQVTNLFTGNLTYTATTNYYTNSYVVVGVSTNYTYFTNIISSTNGTTAYYTNTFPQNAEAVTVLAGTLQLNNAGALSGGANVGNIWVDGTLDLNGISPTINGLEGSGVVDNMAAANTGIYTLTLGNGNSNGVFSGIIQNTAGSVALTKIGYGTETLNGGNIYRGATTINQGTLVVGASGSLGQFSPTLTIGSGAVLDVTALGLTGYYPQVGLTVSAGTPTKPYTNYLGSYDPYYPTYSVSISGTNNVSTYATNTDLTTYTNVVRTTNYVSTTYSSNSIVSVATNDVEGSFNVTGGGAISPITSVSPGIATWSIRDNLSIDNAGGFGPNRVNFLLNNTTVTGGGTNDLIAVGGNLYIGDELDFVITPLKGTLAAGTYTLMTSASYTASGLNSGNAANLVLIEPRGLTDTVQASGNNITLTSSGGTANPGSIIWQGTPASLNWDTHLTQDWKTNGTTIPAIQYFYALDNVIFNDTGVGTITLPLAVSPGSMTFNNSKTNYTFTQNASTFITGTGGLVKTGSGTLTLQNPNSFTGDVTVNGGTLNLGYYSGADYTQHLLYNGVPAGNLILGGGTINQNSIASSSQSTAFQNLTVNPGASAITQSGRGSNELPWYDISNNVTRAVGGVLNVITTGKAGSHAGLYFASTNSPDGTNDFGANGIVGGWAIYNQSDWLYANTANTDAQGGNMAYPYYQNVNISANWGATSNVQVGASVSGVNNVIINSLKFSNASPVTITINSGQTLTNVSGGILVPSGGTVANAINGGTLMGAAGQDLILLQNSTGGTLTIGSVIANNGGATGLTMGGSGTSILLGNNTYTGPTYINGGFGGAAAGSLQIGNGNASGSIANSSAVIDNGVLTFNRSDNTTVSGNTSGLGSLTQAGAGTLTLTANNSLSGLVTISSGTLELGNGGAAGSVSNTVGIVNNGTLVFNNNNTVGYPQRISGSGKLVQFGIGGTLVIATNETYSGNTIVSNGTIKLTASGTISNTPAIVVNAGAVLDVSAAGLTLRSAVPSEILAGSGAINGSVTTAAGTKLTPGTNGVVGTLTISGNLTLAGGSYIFEVGTNSSDKILVGNLNQNSGNVVINALNPLTNGIYRLIYATNGLNGTLAGSLGLAGFGQIGQIASLTNNSTPNELDLWVRTGVNPSVTWHGDGGPNYWDTSASNWKDGGGSPVQYANYDFVTFDDSGSNNTPINLQIVVSATGITNNSTANYTFGAAGGSGVNKITGGGNLIKSGSGTLTLQTTNDYLGGTTINAGAIQLGDNIAATDDGSLGSGSVVNNGTLIANNFSTETISGPISGSGLLVQQGAGKLILSGNNTAFTGPITVSNLLQVGDSISGTLGTGNVTNNGTVIFNVLGSLAVNQSITGSGSISNVAGTLTLSGTNTYAGATAISGGKIIVGNSNAIPTTTTLLLPTGTAPVGTLDLNGFDLNVANLGGGNTGNNTANFNPSHILNNGGTTTNTLTLDGAATNTFYGQIIDNNNSGSGKIKLLVSNGRYLTLQAYSTASSGNVAFPNTFSGGIIVSNASLQLGINSGATYLTAEGGAAAGTGPITLTGTNAVLWTHSSTGNINDQATTALGIVNVPTNQTATIYGPGRATFSCTLQGGGNLTYIIEYSRSRLGGNLSAFSGTLTLADWTAPSGGAGGNLGIDGTAGLPLAAVVMQNTNISQLQMVGTTSGNVFPIGSLSGGDNTSLLGGGTSASGDGTANTVWAIGSLNTTTTNGSQIVDAGCGLRKVGSGILVLTNNVLSYGGQTVVSNGTLAFAPLGNYTNGVTSLFTALTNNYLVGSSITIVSPGILDVSQAGNTLYLISSVRGQTLSGNGTLTGDLFVTNSIIAPGSRLGNANIYPGQLTVSGSATFGSGSTFRMAINSTNSPIYDSLAVGGTRTINTARLTVVTNGAAFANGSSNVFRFFSGSVSVGVSSGITNFTLPVVTNSYWVTNLVLDGSMALVNTNSAVSTSTNSFTLTNSFDGANLTLSWPLDHTGYRLQAQTNTLTTGLGTNWVDVAGATTTNKVVIPVGTGNASVFYRLIYP